MNKNSLLTSGSIIGVLLSTVIINYFNNRRIEKYQMESLKSAIENSPYKHMQEIDKMSNNISEMLNEDIEKTNDNIVHLEKRIKETRKNRKEMEEKYGL